MSAARGAWTWLCLAAMVSVFVVMIRSDAAHAAWVSKLSQQGSPAPARDDLSPTGYTLGQRQFLGSYERGETYRWIAMAQQQIRSGGLAGRVYEADTVPTGRPQLMPNGYAWWITAVSWLIHAFTGAPLAISVETAALWAPVALQALAFGALAAFLWIRFGPVPAALGSGYFAVLPLLSAQFLPGVLAPRTAALLLATAALALQVRGRDEGTNDSGFSPLSAVFAALAVWFDPAAGFPCILASAAIGACAQMIAYKPVRFIRWATVGACVIAAAWLIDRTPWDTTASELRYIHPLYALAWLGLGLALDGWQDMRTTGRWRPGALKLAGAAPLVGGLAYVQIRHGFWGWLFPSAAMERLTSLDETVRSSSLVDWFSHAPTDAWVWGLLPIVATVALLVVAAVKASGTSRAAVWLPAIAFAGALVCAYFRIRWIVPVALLSPVIISSQLTRFSSRVRSATGVVAALLVVALAGWGRALAPSFQRPTGAAEPRVVDLNVLIYRHLAHWMASHSGGHTIKALAPPELSDCIVFHGGQRALMSTAWESYPGQVAASRILSAPEASEAEAVLESRQITHVILTSWDRVLPLLVRKPTDRDKTTLYARLQRWVYPPYLRPVPYHLPPVPGYGGQKLVVFKVVPPEDEALSLSRLAEYFVEMDRDEPATLAAKVLGQSFPDDPNAAIARATVFAHTNNRAAFEAELERLATIKPEALPWDRRVQRAIVFGLGNRRALEQAEIAACVPAATPDAVGELTPLQAYRLRALANAEGVRFTTSELDRLTQQLGAEYTDGAGLHQH